MNFLRSKGNYEIQKLQFKKVVRPILSKTPNERWTMDLIRKLLNRTAKTIINNLNNIVETN